MRRKRRRRRPRPRPPPGKIDTRYPNLDGADPVAPTAAQPRAHAPQTHTSNTHGTAPSSVSPSGGWHSNHASSQAAPSLLLSAIAAPRHHVPPMMPRRSRAKHPCLPPAKALQSALLPTACSALYCSRNRTSRAVLCVARVPPPVSKRLSVYATSPPFPIRRHQPASLPLLSPHMELPLNAKPSSADPSSSVVE